MNRTNLIAWILAMIAVISNAALGYYNVRQMRHGEEQMQESLKIQSEYQRLMSLMKDAETGHRGYLLTKKDLYLKPHRESRGRLETTLTVLTEKLQQRPDQAENLEKIKMLIDDKYEEMKRTIEIRNAKDLQAASEAISDDVGITLMEKLRVLVRASYDQETEIQRAISEETSNQYRFAMFVHVAGAILGVGIVVVAIAMSNSELRRRRRMFDSVAAAKEAAESDLKLRLEMEKQLKESEISFRGLTESIPQIVWAANRDGWVQYFNSQWTAFTGLDSAPSQGDHWIGAVHEEDRENCRRIWTRSVILGEAFEIEIRLRRLDGNHRWFLVRARPISSDSDAKFRWLGSMTDIDDSKRLVDELDAIVQKRTATLVEQRTFLDAILNNISEGIVASDANGKLTFNRATQAMHGLPAEALPPEEWPSHYSLYEEDGVTPMKPDRVPLRRAMNGETIRDVVMVIRPRAARESHVLCSGQPLKGVNGRPFGAVVSMRDVTERRVYEQEILQTTRKLRVSNEELEKFAYVASHDLQEPLRKIQAFGNRLEKLNRDALGEEGRDALTRILDATGRMRQLIDDLLAFSRVGSTTRSFAPVDLNTTLEDVRSVFEMRLETSGGRVEILNPLPTVIGDASQLRQVFQNLIGNAVKFAKPDQPPVVKIIAEQHSGGWRITVRDNGIGFEQQYADRIFELFQRLHGRTQYDGTGLGLAIVRKIIQRHGAAITASSEPDQGAVFTIDWPATTRSNI